MEPEYEEGLVSVIIPIYNRAHLIEETLDSVREQTCRPIELIVVDDGSTDDTGKVVSEWSKKTETDHEFDFFYFQQENKGAPAARHLGAIESHGQFIEFWDDHDLMHPEKLAKLVRAANRTGADLVVSDVAYFRNTVDDVDRKWHCGSLAAENINAQLPRSRATGMCGGCCCSVSTSALFAPGIWDLA